MDHRKVGFLLFPDSDDLLIDDYSVVTALITRQEEYPAAVREFAQHPQLLEAFRVGELVLAVAHDQQSLAIGFRASTRTRIVAGDDLTVSNGSDSYMVRAGPVEQNFPSYPVASRFFETLGATVSCVVEGAPTAVRRRYTRRAVAAVRKCAKKEDCTVIRDIVFVSQTAALMSSL